MQVAARGACLTSAFRADAACARSTLQS